jgi:hypothetical protein
MRWRRVTSLTYISTIMWVIFDHLRPSGHIMPDRVGDRGAVRQILEPHDHLHINHERASAFGLASGLTQIIRFGMIPGSYLDD